MTSMISVFLFLRGLDMSEGFEKCEECGETITLGVGGFSEPVRAKSRGYSSGARVHFVFGCDCSTMGVPEKALSSVEVHGPMLPESWNGENQ